MTVELLHATPLIVADIAIGQCWNTGTKEDTYEMQKRMDRVANKNKHGSTIEHINYSFQITGLPRFVLQELARHRHQSLSVKSSRYTISELKTVHLQNADNKFNCEIIEKYIYLTGNKFIDEQNIKALLHMQRLLRMQLPNDKVKQAMPEAYLTDLVSTFNARSFQNFLSLRTDKSALKEIRDLAFAMYDAIPDHHKFLFQRYLKPRDTSN